MKVENSTTVVDNQQAGDAQDEAIVTSSSSMNQPNFKSKGALTSLALDYRRIMQQANHGELNQVMLGSENEDQGVWIEEG